MLVVELMTGFYREEGSNIFWTEINLQIILMQIIIKINSWRHQVEINTCEIHLKISTWEIRNKISTWEMNLKMLKVNLEMMLWRHHFKNKIICVYPVCIDFCKRLLPINWVRGSSIQVFFCEICPIYDAPTWHHFSCIFKNIDVG